MNVKYQKFTYHISLTSMLSHPVMIKQFSIYFPLLYTLCLKASDKIHNMVKLKSFPSLVALSQYWLFGHLCHCCRIVGWGWVNKDSVWLLVEVSSPSRGTQFFTEGCQSSLASLCTEYVYTATPWKCNCRMSRSKRRLFLCGWTGECWHCLWNLFYSRWLDLLHSFDLFYERCRIRSKILGILQTAITFRIGQHRFLLNHCNLLLIPFCSQGAQHCLYRPHACGKCRLSYDYWFKLLIDAL